MKLHRCLDCVATYIDLENILNKIYTENKPYYEHSEIWFICI